MIKITILPSRRADLSHDEFIDYWTQKHTPLLAELPGDQVAVERSVQLRPTQTAEADGVAELWVNSVVDAEKWFTSETYTTTVADDERTFSTGPRRASSTPPNK